MPQQAQNKHGARTKACDNVLVPDFRPSGAGRPTALKINSNYRKISTLPANDLNQKLVRKVMATTAGLMSINTTLLIVQRQDIEYWDANPRPRSWSKAVSQQYFLGIYPSQATWPAKSRQSPIYKPPTEKNHLAGHTLPLQMRWIFLEKPLQALTE